MIRYMKYDKVFQSDTLQDLAEQLVLGQQLCFWELKDDDKLYFDGKMASGEMKAKLKELMYYVEIGDTRGIFI